MEGSLPGGCRTQSSLRATTSGTCAIGCPARQQRLSWLRQRRSRRLRRPAWIVHTYPEPETEKERSPLDYPQEWVTPQPSRRPDIFPEFEKMDTPLPKPLPGDPEQPDEEEEEEKKKKGDPKPEEEPEKEEPEEPQPDTE